MKNYQKYIDGSILIVTISIYIKQFLLSSLYTNYHLSYVKFIKKFKTTEMSLETMHFKM